MCCCYLVLQVVESLIGPNVIGGLFSLDSLLVGHVKYPPKIVLLAYIAHFIPCTCYARCLRAVSSFLLLNGLFEATGTRLAAIQ